MRSIIKYMCVITQIFGAYSFIVPDEVPSLLSVIYSNIPTIKKGTDSRLGWGFRLGDRADFQVLVELGPQTYTQPLGNQGQNTNNKRNTLDSLSNTLYAQRQQEKKQISNTEGGKWLDEWSKTVNQPVTVTVPPVQEEEAVTLGIGEVDAKKVIPDDRALKLMQLYKKKLQENETLKKKIQAYMASTERSIESTTSTKEALDNVEIEE